jgi:PHD/YefM family antitoxin component YafN of YafNO toxin-antitoxin module
MNTSSKAVPLPSDEQPIAPVTILDAQGRVVRVVSAEEFRRRRLAATGNEASIPVTARSRLGRRRHYETIT